MERPDQQQHTLKHGGETADDLMKRRYSDETVGRGSHYRGRGFICAALGRQNLPHPGVSV